MPLYTYRRRQYREYATVNARLVAAGLAPHLALAFNRTVSLKDCRRIISAIVPGTAVRFSRPTITRWGHAFAHYAPPYIRLTPRLIGKPGDRGPRINLLDILHECAHIRRGAMPRKPGRKTYDSHGPEFCREYANILTEWIGEPPATRNRREDRHSTAQESRP